MIEVQRITEEVNARVPVFRELEEEIHRVVVGQKALVRRLVLALLADGHVLVEGVPGLAKTTAVRTLAECLKAKFGRIQFTPDLLPADLVGTQIYSPKDGTFHTKQGPLFNHLVLADEVNRAPAKVQSALLEAMQERQVTLGEESHPLPRPFLVLATQNPLEQEGTYPLPEAQLDRFMLKVKVDYPSREEEIGIMKQWAARAPAVTPRFSLEPLLEARDVVERIFVDEKIYEYVASLVHATRRPAEAGLAEMAPWIACGASPRASLWLVRGGRAKAFLEGRGYVTPQDIKDLAPDVLRHRVILSHEGEAREITQDDVVRRILDKVDVP